MSFVQARADLDQNAVSSIALAFFSDVQAGNLISVWSSCELDTTASASDNRGTTYVQVGFKKDPGATFKGFAFVGLAGSSGPCTVTVTYGSAAPFRTIGLMEHSGADPSGALFSGGAGPTTPYDSGPITTSGSTLLLCGAFSFSSVASFTPDAGWTQRYFIFGADALYMFDQDAVNPGTYSATGSHTGTRWIVLEVGVSASFGQQNRFY